MALPRHALLLLVLLLPLPQASAQTDDGAQTDPSSQPVELGSVTWLRHLPAAQAQSKANGKPILLLFQEIPGCETCQTFGNQPLSHPLLVEAIEELFVPLAIYNNKQGTDEEILRVFDEPAWNNPVIRYIGADRMDIIPRKDRVWSVGHTAARMVSALEAAGKQVPAYLRLVAEEQLGESDMATFAMHCYWEGEGQLGSVDGVTDTQSAWVGDKEVVHVKFDPQRVDYKTLLERAQSMQCASTVFARDDQQFAIAKQAVPTHTQRLEAAAGQRVAKESDQKYYLRQTLLRHLPLTALQATRINAALHAGKKVSTTAAELLSPRQLDLLAKIEQALSRNPKALESFDVPTGGNKLAEYQEALLLRLDSLGG